MSVCLRRLFLSCSDLNPSANNIALNSGPSKAIREAEMAVLNPSNKSANVDNIGGGALPMSNSAAGNNSSGSAIAQ